MKATVVTVTYNSAGTLEVYVAGLLANAASLEQVVIVDNGSTDDTWQRLCEIEGNSSLPLTLVRSANLGFAGGYATASQHVREASAVLCCNPDVSLAPDVVRDMLLAMAHNPDAGILTAPLLDESGLPDTASIRRLPKLGTAAIYAAVGRFTPQRWRYNAPVNLVSPSIEKLEVTPIEATTGALMLINPRFRDPKSPIFDTSYWMYGEDLQLCFDAGRDGWVVGMVATCASKHSKGASSGKPRRLKSNVAFHKAMYTYYLRNLRRGRVEACIVAGGVVGRALLSIAISSGTRSWRRLRLRELTRSIT